MLKSRKAPYVVHLIPSLEVGGMERLVSDLAVSRTSGKTEILCLNTLGVEDFEIFLVNRKTKLGINS